MPEVVVFDGKGFYRIVLDGDQVFLRTSAVSADPCGFKRQDPRDEMMSG